MSSSGTGHFGLGLSAQRAGSSTACSAGPGANSKMQQLSAEAAQSAAEGRSRGSRRLPPRLQGGTAQCRQLGDQAASRNPEVMAHTQG